MCRIARQRIDATNLYRPPYCRSVQHALIKGRTKQRDYSRDKVIYTSERVSASHDAMHSSSSSTSPTHFKGRLAGGLSDCVPSVHRRRDSAPKQKLEMLYQDDTCLSNRMWKLSQKATL
jgi:hypothetical protein